MSKILERADVIKPHEFFVAAGPCAIESKEQYFGVSRALKVMGVGVLRSQLWKPRSSGKSFQGLGLDSLYMLARIKEETGMIITTEIVDKDHIAPTRGVVDVPWVGSRNMQNYELLKALAKDDRPVILKRGYGATIKEWIEAADYIGSERVILCERGIRSGTDSTRFTLDLNGALVAMYDKGMPVIGDPSHTTGRRDLVPALTRSIVAAGLNGIVVEVHNDPQHALCDADQQITPEIFKRVLEECRAIHQLISSGLNN